MTFFVIICMVIIHEFILKWSFFIVTNRKSPPEKHTHSAIQCFLKDPILTHTSILVDSHISWISSVSMAQWKGSHKQHPFHTSVPNLTTKTKKYTPKNTHYIYTSINSTHILPVRHTHTLASDHITQTDRQIHRKSQVWVLIVGMTKR